MYSYVVVKTQLYSAKFWQGKLWQNKHHLLIFYPAKFQIHLCALIHILKYGSVQFSLAFSILKFVFKLCNGLVGCTDSLEDLSAIPIIYYSINLWFIITDIE